MTSEDVRIVVEAMAPVIREYVTKAVSGMAERLAAAETNLGRLALAEKALAELGATVGGVRERVAAVEARPLEPGPPGPPGPPGTNGIDGKAGMRYRGIFDDTKAYEPGDVVTYAGSAWYAGEGGTSGKPNESNGAGGWTLIVKRGRDGKGA